MASNNKYIDLVQMAKEGNTTPLINQCAPQLQAIVRRRVPFQDIDDVVQDALCIVLTALVSIQDHERFNGWLNQVANTAIVSYWRNVFRHDMESLPHSLEESTRPDDIALRKEEEDVFWESVGNLQEHKQEVLKRFYIDGQSTKQISVEMNKNHNTVRRWMSEARELLKKRLT